MNEHTFIKNSIKEARKKRRVTQHELAQAIGVSRQTIVSLEKNDYTPSLSLAFKISSYFHEPIENLFQIQKDEQQMTA